jgi:hypothetical protein
MLNAATNGFGLQSYAHLDAREEGRIWRTFVIGLRQLMNAYCHD